MDRNNWDKIITSKVSYFDINLREIWTYRDLLFMFIKREFITFYKQTVLGPLWVVFQPILTSLIYIFIFGEIADLSTNGAPRILFYLVGVATWSYFATSLNKIATIFKDNQGIFGKVYFPRLVMPLSVISSTFIRFSIQFGVFLIVLLYYICFEEFDVSLTYGFLMIIPLLLLMAAIALGLGLIIASFTTKYRDLIFLLQFGIQLFMYATPVVYPLASLPEKYQSLIIFNPMTGILEGIKHPFLNPEINYPWIAIIISAVSALIFLSLGILVFNKTEKNFMDTV